MRKKILIILLILLIGTTVPFAGNHIYSYIEGENEERWWKENSLEIQSITSEDYEDLQFLKPLLRDKKYVFLGESSHGVAEYNLAKVRLAKFLHKEMGFDVIAFESPMAEASIAYSEKELLDYTGKDLLGKSIFRIWYTREVSHLFDYILENQKENSLELTGFDVQNTYDTFPKFIIDNIKQFDPDFAERFQQLEMDFGRKTTNVVQGISGITEEDVSYFKNGYQQAQSVVQANSVKMKEKYKDYPEIIKIVDKELQDRADFTERLYKNNAKNINDFFMVRDEMMAENVEWLANKIFRDKKIIFWGHNGHIRDNLHEGAYKDIGESEFSNWEANSMFGNLPKKMKQQSYNIGLYAYEGKIHNWGQTFVVNDGKKHKKGSLEYTLNKAGHEYSLLDISNQKENRHNRWMYKPIHSLSNGVIPEKFIIQNSYDGLLFIKKVSLPLYYSY